MTTDATAGPDGPGTQGVLVLRAWLEPNDPDATPRARLLVVEDDPLGTTWATTAGVEQVCAEVERWLEHLRARVAPPLVEE